ncbi:MAG TPA: hypothetical protein VND45_11925, partial [Thermoanaerobaculia bacterium]|nr:hypothetical protein [Thermoanaerobaculia bacterium]
MAITSPRGRRAAATFCAAALFGATALVGCGGGGSGANGVDTAANGATATQSALAENDPLNPIQILSSEPSLVSGGDALVRGALPAGTAASAVRV